MPITKQTDSVVRCQHYSRIPLINGRDKRDRGWMTTVNTLLVLLEGADDLFSSNDL